MAYLPIPYIAFCLWYKSFADGRDTSNSLKNSYSLLISVEFYQVMLTWVWKLKMHSNLNSNLETINENCWGATKLKLYTWISHVYPLLANSHISIQILIIYNISLSCGSILYVIRPCQRHGNKSTFPSIHAIYANALDKKWYGYVRDKYISAVYSLLLGPLNRLLYEWKYFTENFMITDQTA